MRVFLNNNLSEFAWTPTDVLGINQSVASREIRVDENHKFINQKKRNNDSEKQKASANEVDHILESNFILAVKLLANIIMVKKRYGMTVPDVC